MTPARTKALLASLQAFVAAAARPPDPERSLALFVDLFDAIRPRRSKDQASGSAHYIFVIEHLEADAALAAAMRGQLQSLLSSRRLQRFFADSGILPATGFFSELGRIVSSRLLPEVPDNSDFRGCLQQVFHRPDDWVWLQDIPTELTLRFWHALAPASPAELAEFAPTFEYVTDQIIEALLVLSYRIGALGSEPELDRLGPSFARHTVRFHATAAAAQRFADAWRRHQVESCGLEGEIKDLDVMLDQSREALDDAHRIALRRGTSLHLTYVLQRSRQTLDRIERLTELLGHAHALEGEGAMIVAWSSVFREALRMDSRRNSPSLHIASGIEMLALRVTDNAAKTGEHYIAETPAQYAGMWRAAAGAGVIIAAMALLKIFSGKLDLAPAGYALLYSLNYGLGFVVIYMLHLTVATKQPAMTAQTIAGYLGSASQGRVAELDRVVELAAAVTRSQLAAILGNVLLAMPAALLIAWALNYAAGAPIIDMGKAAHLLDDLDPLGWAIPHAAVAGIFLFLSGLISGYFDNKASYARIGERVAQLRWLRTLFGSDRAEAVGNYLENHLGGIMGNFLFGCMLGSTGTIGQILGLPVDIRHIAFASANLGYAWQAFDYALPLRTLLWAGLGVALIGFTNLAVSFALALWMALRARGVEFTQTGELLRRLWLLFKSRPALFLLPLRTNEAPAEAQPEKPRH
jgi:site-specific recombinase